MAELYFYDPTLIYLDLVSTNGLTNSEIDEIFIKNYLNNGNLATFDLKIDAVIFLECAYDVKQMNNDIIKLQRLKKLKSL